MQLSISISMSSWEDHWPTVAARLTSAVDDINNNNKTTIIRRSNMAIESLQGRRTKFAQYIEHPLVKYSVYKTLQPVVLYEYSTIHFYTKEQH